MALSAATTGTVGFGGRSLRKRRDTMKLADLTAGYVEKVDASTPLAEAARWMVSRGVGRCSSPGKGG